MSYNSHGLVTQCWLVFSAEPALVLLADSFAPNSPWFSGRFCSEAEEPHPSGLSTRKKLRQSQLSSVYHCQLLARGGSDEAVINCPLLMTGCIMWEKRFKE